MCKIFLFIAEYSFKAGLLLGIILGMSSMAIIIGIAK